jgi:PAS domain S-box-containing protein
LPQLSADLYRRIVETSREGVWLLDRKGRTSFANARLAEMLGTSPTELVGMPLLAFVDPEQRPRAERALRAPVAGQADQLEARLRRRDGQTVWVVLALSPFQDADGGELGVLAMVSDITQRKRVEAELRASEQRARRLIESNIIGITIGDLEGRILEANDALLRLVGYTRADLSSGQLRWDRLTPPEYMPREEQAIAEAHRFGAATPWEKEYIRKDGQRIPVLLGFALLDEAAGTTVAFILDLSERKRAENRQRVMAEASRTFSAARLQLPTLFETIAQYVAEQLGDGCALYLLSEEGERLDPPCVYDAGDEAGDLARSLVGDTPAGHGAGLVDEVMRVQEPLLVQAPLADQGLALGGCAGAGWPDLERFGLLSVAAAPLRVKGQVVGALVAWRRGPGQPHTQAELSMLEELADRAALAIDNARLYQHMEAAVRVRDEVLGAVSHDLKNPITIVKVQAQRLAQRLRRGGRIQTQVLLEALGEIDAAAGRMNTWIDELLDVARLQVGQELALNRAPTDLVGLVREAVADHQRATQQHTLHLSSTVTELVGDYDAPRVRRVLDNLLSNAIKYSPDGGDVEVRLAVAESGPGQWAVLQVIDRGIGIPAADRPRIFERFHRGGNVAGRIAGTGIGLAGAARIVEQHGGRIEVESEEGQGSTFSVWLPLGSGSRTASAAA